MVWQASVGVANQSSFKFSSGILPLTRISHHGSGPQLDRKKRMGNPGPSWNYNAENGPLLPSHAAGRAATQDRRNGPLAEAGCWLFRRPTNQNGHRRVRRDLDFQES